MWKWSVACQCISDHIQPPWAWHSRPIGSALRLRKQHLMLLCFPLSALDFRSCLPFFKFAEFFPLFLSLSWTFSPLGILSFFLKLSVKIQLVVQGPHSPWNLCDLRYPLLTLNLQAPFLYHLLWPCLIQFCIVAWGISYCTVWSTIEVGPISWSRTHIELI